MNGRISTILVLIFALNSNLISQGSLVVKANETAHIKYEGTDNVTQVVENWIMEDNSTLVIDSRIKTWSLTANIARFGKKVRVVAIGSNAKSGKSGKNGVSRGSTCRYGGGGDDGENGGHGDDGVNLELSFDLESVGSMTINTTGGIGGVGGKGGNGYNGGKADCGKACRGGDGGHAGDGGHGGMGGNAGLVYIEFDYLNDTPPSNNLKGVKIISKGGSGASGGKAGNPGTGGTRTRKNACGVWPVKWTMGSGSKGAKGVDRSRKKSSNGKEMKPIVKSRKKLVAKRAGR